MYNVHVAYMCTCTYACTLCTCTCKYISYKMPYFKNFLQYNINCSTWAVYMYMQCAQCLCMVVVCTSISLVLLQLCMLVFPRISNEKNKFNMGSDTVPDPSSFLYGKQWHCNGPLTLHAYVRLILAQDPDHTVPCNVCSVQSIRQR